MAKTITVGPNVAQMVEYYNELAEILNKTQDTVEAVVDPADVDEYMKGVRESIFNARDQILEIIKDCLFQSLNETANVASEIIVL